MLFFLHFEFILGSMFVSKIDKKRYEIWIYFWRVLGVAPGIPGGIESPMFVGPGVPGEGRGSPKVMWDISMDPRI